MECNICLDTARDAVVTFCGHLYCWPCLYRWLHNGHNVCPVCKAGVTRESVIPLYGRGGSAAAGREAGGSRWVEGTGACRGACRAATWLRREEIVKSGAAWLHRKNHGCHAYPARPTPSPFQPRLTHVLGAPHRADPSRRQRLSSRGAASHATTACC